MQCQCVTRILKKTSKRLSPIQRGCVQECAPTASQRLVTGAAQASSVCLTPLLWAREASTAAALSVLQRPLEENSPVSGIQTSSGQAALRRESRALVRTLHAMYLLATNQHFQAGYRGALWSSSKGCKPPSVIRKHMLLWADSRTKPV